MTTRRTVLASLLAAAAPAQDPLKLFVLSEMEGTSGIFTRGQAWYWESGVREQVAVVRTIDGAMKVSKMPGVSRLDDHTVEARVGRQCDILQWLSGTGLAMEPA